MKSLRHSNLVIFIVIALLSIGSAGLLIAQDQDGYPAPPATSDASAQQQGYPAQGQQQDPPGRVARVQYMSGEVSIQPGGVNDWIAASQNRPLTTADRIWTDKNARAELNVGDGFLRMNSETSVTLTNVGTQNVQLEVDQGTLNVSVRHLAPGEIYEIDTPNYAFTITKSGVYRFDVYPAEDQSWVTVRSGEGSATGQGGAVRVKSGQQVRFSSGTSMQHVAEGAPARDGFDDWVQVRDKRLDSSLSARYVSPGVIGYQDLDQYGRWEPAPQYGNVWVPYSVAPGWAPYRFGHWVWIAPWGWTWVDDAPWGFAPFHYGRWVVVNGGWAWAPGPVGYWQPYYAPALVGWVGGPGFGVGVSFGGGFGIGVNFGWFPLGWGEPYYPRYCGWGHGGWYRGGGYVSNNYFRNVNVTNTNITNITNITNNYYNGAGPAAHYGFRNRPGAVTGAPTSAFTSGAPINRVGGAIPAANLGRGNVLRGVDVNPTREAVLGGHAPQTRGVPPASAFNRPVVTANPRSVTPRPANIETANQATIARNNGQPVATHGTVSAAQPGAAVNNNRGTANGNTRWEAPPARGISSNKGTGVSEAPPARGVTSNKGAGQSEVPTAQGGHYVPRPPSAGGNPAMGVRSGATTAPVGSPNNGNATRPNTNGAAEGRTPTAYGAPRGGAAENGTPRPYGAPQNGVPQTNNGAVTPRTNPSYEGQRGNVTQTPRPPQTSEPSRTPTAAPSRPATPPAHESPPSRDSSHGDGSRGPGASLSVPRPPANYSYRPPAGYSASTGNEGSRPISGYSAPNHGVSSQPSYGGSRNASSVYSAPSRSSQPTYSAPSRGGYSQPTYSAPSRGSMPTYSAPPRQSAPVYSSRNVSSAPRTSGGGGSPHQSSGSSRNSGGGSHAPSNNNNGGGNRHSR